MEAWQMGSLATCGIFLFLLILGWLVRRHRFKLAKISREDFDFRDPSIENFPGVNSSLSGSRKEEPFYQTQRIEKEVPKKTTQKLPLENSILSISVFARPNTTFGSYDLLQAISAVGMQFGEMNIFHYYSLNNEKSIKLFSLASATKPGYFNLDHIGDFSCVGLTLFMDMQAVPDPGEAFNIMLATAEQLAEDLEGELRSDPHTLWDDNLLDGYQKKILQYS